MALLAKLIDTQTVSRAGDGLTGVAITTLFHSLTTNPQAVIPVIRSVEAIGASNLNKGVNVMYVGANASCLSIGYHSITGASAPTIMFDVYTIRFHSYIQ